MLGHVFRHVRHADPDQLRALDAAEKFIKTKMTPQDLMAIMKFSGSGVEVLDDFTANREELLTSIQKLVVGDAQGNDEDPRTTAMPIPARLSARTTANSISSPPIASLAALQTAVKMLGQLNEKKALIYFASGLRLNGTNNQAQLQATVNAAIRPMSRLSHRRARPGGAASDGRCDQGLARRHRHVFRGFGDGHGQQLPEDRRTRSTRWLPIPAARRCSITTT